jgi:two-component system sensor histidine kinase/response regulator
VNQELAMVMVRTLGYDGDLATTGAEVLDALQRIPYDLVLMDCQMPEMDGYAAAAEIRRSTGPIRLVPIVAMTAHVLAGDREKCLAAGMNDHLGKPLRVDELRAALARWLPPTTGSDPAEVKGSTATSHDLGRADLPASPDMPQRAPAPSPLDVNSLKRIRDLAQCTDPTLVARVLNAFATDSARRMATLREAAGKEDFASLANEAHGLKGASLNVGATRMAQIAQRVYERSLEKRMTGMDEFLEQLEGELIRAKGQIEIELKTV